jgi:hypothetical protein
MRFLRLTMSACLSSSSVATASRFGRQAGFAGTKDSPAVTAQPRPRESGFSGVDMGASLSPTFAVSPVISKKRLADVKD